MIQVNKTIKTSNTSIPKLYIKICLFLTENIFEFCGYLIERKKERMKERKKESLKAYKRSKSRLKNQNNDKSKF